MDHTVDSYVQSYSAAGHIDVLMTLAKDRIAVLHIWREDHIKKLDTAEVKYDVLRRVVSKKSEIVREIFTRRREGRQRAHPQQGSHYSPGRVAQGPRAAHGRRGVLPHTMVRPRRWNGHGICGSLIRGACGRRKSRFDT